MAVLPGQAEWRLHLLTHSPSSEKDTTELRQGSARRNRLPRIGNHDIHRHVETTFGEGGKLRQVDDLKKAAAISISSATIP